MKKLITLFAVLFAVLVSACAFNVEEKAPPVPTETVQNPDPGVIVAEPKPAMPPIRVVRPAVELDPTEPTLVVTTTGMPTDDVAVGSSNNPLHGLTMTARNADMEVMAVQFQFYTPDFSDEDSTPYCAAPCTDPEDWNFRNLKMVRKDGTIVDGTVVMGPIETPKPMTKNSLAVIVFRDPVFIENGETIRLEVRGDVAKKATSIAGKRFMVVFDGAATRDYVALSHIYAKGVKWDATFTIK